MKIKQFSTVLFFSIFSLAACGETPTPKAQSAVAVSARVSESVKNTIVATLEKNYADQNIKVQSVQSTPITGVYEVVVNGRQIAYVDTKGEYMLLGELIDTKSGESLTQLRQQELNKVDFSSLPLNKAIKEVRGNGRLKVAVFSDADCPFCHRLEQEFAKMSDTTIYNFMMPIDTLHPDADAKSIQILCQANPTKAWTEWMREGKKPPKVPECNTTLQDTLKLGESLGFNGTPTIVFPNGKIYPGFAPMPKLKELIEQNQ